MKANVVKENTSSNADTIEDTMNPTVHTMAPPLHTLQPDPLASVTATPSSSPSDVTKGTTTFRRLGMRGSKLCQPSNVLLMGLTCAGIVLGFAIGFGVRELQPSEDALMWLGMPGELFIRMLKLMILPLIVCSVISATAALDPKVNGKISGVAFIFIVVTNVIACVIGIVLCLLIKPGGGHEYIHYEDRDEGAMETHDIFADLFRNIVPDNMVQATFLKARTEYEKGERQVFRYLPNETDPVVDTEPTRTKRVVKADGVNVLGLIVFCSLVGIAMNKVRHKAAVFIGFFSGATEVIIVIVRWLFWLTPLGVCSLIATSVAGVWDLKLMFSQLGLFVLAVCVGLVLQGLVILPAILIVFTRRNPFAYILSIMRPVMIGFASTSTAVAIPEMLEACETNNIDSRAARFVIPFCVTLNADGSALYIVSAAIFTAQFTGVGVDVSDVFIIGFLTAVTSMAIPSVPSSSIVTLVIILTSLNIPVDVISLLFAVEWILDRARTACNVISHTFCAAVTYKLCQKDLAPTETTGLSADGEQSSTKV